MGVARDNYGATARRSRTSPALPKSRWTSRPALTSVLDFLAVADVGTVIHPRNLGGQILGGIMLGLGHALGQKWVYDQHYGVPLARRFYQTQAADDSRRAGDDAVGRARHP